MRKRPLTTLGGEKASIVTGLSFQMSINPGYQSEPMALIGRKKSALWRS